MIRCIIIHRCANQFGVFNRYGSFVVRQREFSRASLSTCANLQSAEHVTTVSEFDGSSPIVNSFRSSFRLAVSGASDLEAICAIENASSHCRARRTAHSRCRSSREITVSESLSPVDSEWKTGTLWTRCGFSPNFGADRRGRRRTLNARERRFGDLKGSA